MPKNRGVKKVKGKRSKEVMKMIKDGKLTDMFNQMLGVEAADPQIVGPRYQKCRIIISTLSGFMGKFSDNESLNDLFTNQVENFKKIRKFSEKLTKLITDKPLNEETPPEEVAKIYLELKNHDVTKSLFVIYSQIKRYKDYLEDYKNLRDDFIMEEPGFEVYPFKKICKLNLYIMWVKNPPDDAKTYVLKFLHQVYKLTKILCETLIQADVDIGNFSEILVSCITEAKKLIPNCNEAFRRIESAVGLLENNFDGYYKDFVKTENPSIIILNFVSDVSNDQKKSDIRLIVQFRKIISHFQNATRGQVNNNPQMKSLFDMLNSHMSTLEKTTGEQKDAEPSAADEEEEYSDSSNDSDDDYDEVPELIKVPLQQPESTLEENTLEENTLEKDT